MCITCTYTTHHTHAHTHTLYIHIYVPSASHTFDLDISLHLLILNCMYMYISLLNNTCSLSLQQSSATYTVSTSFMLGVDSLTTSVLPVYVQVRKVICSCNLIPRPCTHPQSSYSSPVLVLIPSPCTHSQSSYSSLFSSPVLPCLPYSVAIITKANT